jgi:hypothetical protein
MKVYPSVSVTYLLQKYVWPVSRISTTIGQNRHIFMGGSSGWKQRASDPVITWHRPFSLLPSPIIFYAIKCPWRLLIVCPNALTWALCLPYAPLQEKYCGAAHVCCIAQLGMSIKPYLHVVFQLCGWSSSNGSMLTRQKALISVSEKTSINTSRKINYFLICLKTRSQRSSITLAIMTSFPLFPWHLQCFLV